MQKNKNYLQENEWLFKADLTNSTNLCALSGIITMTCRNVHLLFNFSDSPEWNLFCSKYILIYICSRKWWEGKFNKIANVNFYEISFEWKCLEVWYRFFLAVLATCVLDQRYPLDVTAGSFLQQNAIWYAKQVYFSTNCLFFLRSLAMCICHSARLFVTY